MFTEGKPIKPEEFQPDEAYLENSQKLRSIKQGLIPSLFLVK